MQEQLNHSTIALSLEDLFVAVYVIVDDLYKKIVPKDIQDRGKKNNAEPILSDSEVITIGLVGELLGIDSERAWLGFVKKNCSYLFPNLLERSRYNRRRRDLFKIIDLLRKELLRALSVSLDPFRIIDSVPIPVCHYVRSPRCKVFKGEASFGVCESKDEKIYGFKLHLLTTIDGVITNFVLAKASPHDVSLVWDLTDCYQNLNIIGDKGYVSKALEEELLKERDTHLLAMKRKNQKEYSKKGNALLSSVRKIVETILSQLTEQFNLSRVLAKSLWGLVARINTKILAYTLANFINKIFGLSMTNIKDLVFN